MNNQFVFSEENITKLKFSQLFLESYKTQSSLKKIKILLLIIVIISAVGTYHQEYSFLLAGLLAFVGISFEYFRLEKRCPIKQQITRADYLTQKQITEKCIETFKAAILINNTPIKETDRALAHKFATGFFTRDSELPLLIFFAVNSQTKD